MLRRLCFVVSLLASFVARPAVAEDTVLLVFTVSYESGDRVPGACFEVYIDTGSGARGALVETFCDGDDGADGIVTIPLPAGPYILAETQPPDGFAVTREALVEVLASQRSQEIRIPHQPVTSATPIPTPTETPTPQNTGSALIQQRFEIEPGRHLYLSCQGNGGPTVVLEAGGPGRYSSDWQMIQPEIATTVRTCVYDRASLGQSDPAPPGLRTVDDNANDLHRLLSVAGVTCPCVFVGSSWGGVIVRRYAAMFPEDIDGLVLVDGIPPGFLSRFLELVPDGDAPALVQERVRLLGANNLEQIDQLTSMKLADDSDPPPPVPAAVMTHNLDLGLGFSLVFPVKELEQEWRQAQETYATLINARLIVAEKSGSDIVREQPELVLDAIRYVIGVIQDPASGLGTIQVFQIDRGKTPVANACLQLRSAAAGNDKPYEKTECDANDGLNNGSTTFEDVPPGHYILEDRLLPPGYLPAAERPVNVPPGDVARVLIVYETDPTQPTASPPASPVAAGQ
jgi:pimeloyl-ACP methyl ester carboxylesterase